eukprot:8996100-Pyramimonas_sp.AAC.1
MYFNALRGVSSVGAPTWEQRCADRSSMPRRLSMYCWGLDADCQLFSRLATAKMANSPYVCTCAT